MRLRPFTGPREGMQVTEKPSVMTVKFGDGYQQRRPAGLNAQLKTFQVVFRVTTDAERRCPGFCHGMVVTGLFVEAPKHNRTVRAVCREWSITDNARYSDFSCTIEQVVN
ncbi:phage tail protein [Escherichia coli]|nr:phage tail protein [Escherichia coli]